MDVNTYEYEMKNGDKVNMSVAMITLYKLRAKDKAAYEKVSKGISKGSDDKDALVIIEFLYGAYRAANQEEETPMTLEYNSSSFAVSIPDEELSADSIFSAT